MKRITIFAGGTLAALAIAWFLTSDGLDALAQEKESRTIEATECTISLVHSAILASERVGTLRAVEFEAGQEVRKGAIVATLRDEIAVAALRKAQKEATSDVQIKYASKAAEFATAELDIAKAANTRLDGTVPQVEIKKLELGEQRGVLQIEQAQFEQDVAKLTVNEALAQVDSYVVTAPFDGIVRKVHLEPGEAVRQGDPIVEIYSESRMRITGYITIAQSYKVSTGDAVKVQLNLKDDDLAIEKIWLDGKIMLVDPEGSPLLNRVQVVAEVENKKFDATKYILTAGLDATMWIAAGSRGATQAKAPGAAANNR